MEKTENLRNYFKGLITSETPAEDIEKYNGFLKELDDLDSEHQNTQNELTKCKDTIVTLVNKQGSANPPKDAVGNNPRSLEEIAQSVINGGK